MKRIGPILLLVLLLLVPFRSHENPLIPTAISELIVTGPTNWVLELESWEPDTLDDWIFATTSDTVGFKPGIILGGRLVLITPYQLERPVSLNVNAESIFLDGGDWSSQSFLSYGPTGTEDIAAPRAGQSICSSGLVAEYYLDSTPTIGQPNDTINATGYIQGTVTTTGGDPVRDVEIYTSWTGPAALTDSLGHFMLHDIAKRVRLEPQRPGYGGTLFVDVQIWPDSTTSLTIIMDPIGSVDAPPEGLPFSGWALSPNYPNPFNPTTTIHYRIPREELVVLDILSVTGELVTNLVSEVRREGQHVLQFDARQLPSGVYFCRMQAGPFLETRKMLLIR